MTLTPLTITVLVILGIIVAGLYFVSHKLEEFDHVYMYATWASLIAVLLAAVYLAFAVPSVASTASRTQTQQKTGTVIVDDSNLLQE